MSSSAVEKGMVIRKIFNEAFERVRGPGVRAGSLLSGYSTIFYTIFTSNIISNTSR